MKPETSWSALIVVGFLVLAVLGLVAVGVASGVLEMGM
jgi:hypothetical protein